MTTLLWLRDDLRVHDHPALSAALQDDGVVVALWIRNGMEESAEFERQQREIPVAKKRLPVMEALQIWPGHQ